MPTSLPTYTEDMQANCIRILSKRDVCGKSGQQSTVTTDTPKQRVHALPGLGDKLVRESRLSWIAKKEPL